MENKNRSKRMNRRTFIKLSSGAVVAVSANWFLPHIVLGSDDEIRLGVLCSLSGVLASTGKAMLQGKKLAVDNYNKQGGILGRKIKLIVEDMESKKDVGLAKARKLVERDKVHYLTGVSSSAIAMAIQAYSRDKKVIFMNTMSSNDLLVKPPNCHRYYFKNVQGTSTTTLAIREPARRIGPKWYIITLNLSWGKISAEYYAKSLKLAVPDAEVVGVDFVNLGETNYAPYITKAIAAKPDGLCLSIFGAGYTRSLKAARDMGLDCDIYIFAYFRNLALAAGEAIEGVYTSSLYLLENSDVSRARWFAEACKKKYGKWPGLEAALAFDGVESLMEGVKTAGTTETEAVVDAIENLEYKNNILAPVSRFRKGDHQVDRGIYSALVTKDPKYTYRCKMIDYDPKPYAFVKPDGQTGCEEYTKRQ